MDYEERISARVLVREMSGRKHFHNGEVAGGHPITVDVIGMDACSAKPGTEIVVRQIGADELEWTIVARCKEAGPFGVRLWHLPPGFHITLPEGTPNHVPRLELNASGQAYQADTEVVARIPKEKTDG
jgi:hypothetical protein